MNKELSANTNLSHYRIAKKIGAGGMGEVYLAEDTRLNCKRWCFIYGLYVAFRYKT